MGPVFDKLLGRVEQVALPLQRERAESFKQVVLEKLLTRIALYKAELFAQFAAVDTKHTGLVRSHSPLAARGKPSITPLG